MSHFLKIFLKKILFYLMVFLHYGILIMNKSDILEFLSSKFNYLPNSEVEKIFSKIINSFTDSLSSDERIEIRGFGTFTIKKRDERIGRNPRTGKEIKIASKRSIHFKSSKELKRLLNEKSAE